jgi:hypothetical protein
LKRNRLIVQRGAIEAFHDLVNGKLARTRNLLVLTVVTGKDSGFGKCVGIHTGVLQLRRLETRFPPIRRVTGSLTLLGASTNYQAFSVAGDGAVIPYTIVDSTNNVWETGTGTYTLSGTTLSRDTILANSSGTTSALNLSAGTKTVFLALPAELTSLDLPATLTTPTQNQSIQANSVAMVESDSYVLPPGFVTTLNSGSVLLLNPPMYPAGNYTPYNYLINGGFDFAQRQAPATLTNLPSSDSSCRRRRFLNAIIEIAHCPI